MLGIPPIDKEDVFNLVISIHYDDGYDEVATAATMILMKFSMIMNNLAPDGPGIAGYDHVRRRPSFLGKKDRGEMM